jgi:serine/threonine-protein kinase
MNEIAQLDALLRRWQDLQQQGQPTPPEQLCADYPDLLPRLKQQIAALPSTAGPGQADSDQVSVDTTRPEARAGATPADFLLPTPQTFAGYAIVGMLGQGGMGVVYQARHPTLGIDVALKTMRFDAADTGLAERFVREAQAVVRLNHPHIVRLFEAGCEQGVHFYTMALVGGGTLHRRRKEFQGDARRVVALVEKVARGVGHAHEKGIVHRDLKPSNILLDDQGEPLVSDFGLAKFVERDSDLTASGVVLGTAAYMAPEQASGDNSRVCPASDVWALGVMLYELLTGAKPFTTAPSTQAAADSSAAEPARPSSLNRRLDRALETVILKCLEKDPARRFRSATELADDLGRWLRGERILSRPVPWHVRAGRALRRRPLVTAAVVLAAVGLAAWFAWQWYADPERPLREAQRRFQGGRPVTLVDDSGRVPWQRWVVGGADAQLVPGKGDACFVGCASFALLELFPPPAVNAYRFEAQVRQDDVFEGGTVGLYFCHSEVPEGSGKHYFAALDFAERGVLKGQGNFHLFGHWDPQVGRPWNPRTTVGKTVPLKPGQSPWRHLVVEVRPANVRLFVDEMLHGEYTFKHLQTYQMDLLPISAPGTGPLPGPEFGPQQGLGLFVLRGQASFRSVTLSPLQE